MILSWGELLWDIFPDGDRLGGCAGNVAYHTAQLTGRAGLVSRVGNDDWGRRAVDRLRQAGVDVRGVQTDPSAPTGMVNVDIAGGEPRFSIVDRAAWDRIEYDEPVRKLVREATVLVFGTLAQRTELGSMALRRALDESAPDCLRVCDLNIRPPFDRASVIDASIARARVVKLNEMEARRLGDVYGTPDVIRWLHRERNVEVVALTRAEHGSVISAAGERVEHPGAGATAGGDPVGAGDAFTAVLAALLPRVTDLGRVSDAANRYAGFVAGCPGAMPIVPEAIKDAVKETASTG